MVLAHCGSLQLDPAALLKVRGTTPCRSAGVRDRGRCSCVYGSSHMRAQPVTLALRRQLP